MYVCITNIDSITNVPCTEAPMRNGPAIPELKGFQLEFENISEQPIPCDSEGKYVIPVKYWGTCDEDANLSIFGILYTLTPEQYASEKREEFFNRTYPTSWTFNETTISWESPVPRPETGSYVWDEDSLNWVEF